MRVQLLVGPGWNPFAPLPGDDVALVEIDASDRLDEAASAVRLAGVLRRLVGDEYPDATIDVLPGDAEEGQLAVVTFEPGDLAHFEDLTGVPAESVADPERDGPAMVREAIDVLLGEALETPGWRVERSGGQPSAPG
jgi:hypothetical protein